MQTQLEISVNLKFILFQDLEEIKALSVEIEKNVEYLNKEIAE